MYTKMPMKSKPNFFPEFRGKKNEDLSPSCYQRWYSVGVRGRVVKRNWTFTPKMGIIYTEPFDLQRVLGRGKKLR